MTDSPWRQVLGAEVDALHPRLAAYFSRIPDGHVGRGRGTFATVGTPRRWLYPALGVLARLGIVFPVWEHDVPFTVENRAHGDEVRARRTFRFADGDQVMVDAIGVERGRLVDRLGRGGTMSASFDATVVEGALQLRSRRVAWRGIPFPLTPIVRLTERFDETVGRQHVALTMDIPAIGRVYEYAGWFEYEIVEA